MLYHRSSLPLLITSYAITLLCSMIILITTQATDHFEIDSPGYHRVALHFAQTGIPGDPEEPETMPEHPIGYHLFLGVLYSIFGSSYYVPVLAQIALLLLMLTLLYTTLNKLAIPPFFGMVFFLINIGALTYAQYIHADILLMTVLMFFMFTMLTALTQHTMQSYLLAGLFLGLSVLIRPAGLFFGMALPIMGIISERSKKSLQKWLIFAFFYSVPILSYMSFNFFTYNQFRLTSLMQENLYNYFFPRHVLPYLPHEEQEQLIRTLDFTKDYSKKSHLYQKCAIQHPFLCVFGWCSSVIRTFFGLYSTQLKVLYNSSIKGGACSYYLMHGSALHKAWRYITYGAHNNFLIALTAFEAAFLPCYYFFILLGCWYLLRKKKYVVLIFLITYCANFAGVTGHGAHARYRLMLEPALIILASYGIVLLKHIICHYQELTVKSSIEHDIKL